ncbi:hypothetical protein MGMO_188c00040 [Methyloglobulus morosus KoM1]|uniref:Uncharacterized protein n=1 Tax=Methyloglobulus morosus KoM1 TaxID=1116472 RepID=V5B001_9GAMM|nr:hypothetical protein MGMO_188c00040 [Methyloglobulus morosus KoM1]
MDVNLKTPEKSVELFHWINMKYYLSNSYFLVKKITTKVNCTDT